MSVIMRFWHWRNPPLHGIIAGILMAEASKGMKWLTALLVLLLVLLQGRLWWGKNSIPDYRALEQQIAQMQQQNAKLTQRNSLLKADIDDLRLGLEAMEERARNELGMIKPGETFYRILPSQ